jgi:hypothetical protein
MQAHSAPSKGKVATPVPVQRIPPEGSIITLAYGRAPDILLPVKGDLYHIAPIPVIYHEVSVSDLAGFNADLRRIARDSMSQAEIEVPDVRHHADMGKAIEFDDDSWSETQIPAIGVWHCVPTNNFLEDPAEPVQRLKSIVEDLYRFTVQETADIKAEQPCISESWIQFYKDGDHKVLHNHERYGPPYPEERWCGAYYLDDGTPDPAMPYSGMFSFRVRQTSYFIKPKPGLLLMWPADILHEVAPFYGKSERVVINFNINLRPL